MAYSTSNPPMLQSQTIANNACAHWIYTTTDAQAVAAANGYITNARMLGMKVGDSVTIYNTVTPTFSVHRVLTINANGSADLTDGVTQAIGNAG